MIRRWSVSLHLLLSHSSPAPSAELAIVSALVSATLWALLQTPMLRATAWLPTLFAKHVLNASLAFSFTYVIRLQRTPEPSRNSELANQQ